MQQSSVQSTKWLNAQSDKKISLKTLPSCMTLCDLKSDGYSKLIAAEVQTDDLTVKNGKLKVFKGTGMVREQSLPGVPSAVVSFYIDEPDPKIPIIAVSIGPSVLFYRNMKPYYKYTLPSLPLQELEKEMWRKMPYERTENLQGHIEELRSVEISQLTTQSQKLLHLVTLQEREIFIKEFGEADLQRLSTITAMTILHRTSADTKPPSCLVLAAENGEIFLLDTQAFTILYQARICSTDLTPSHISASGLYDTDFKIIIATRERSLCLLRKSWLEGREIIKLDHFITDMAILPIDQTVVLTGTDNFLSCYSKKGKKLWSVKFDQIPICMCPVQLPYFGINLVCVALKDGLVRLYSQRNCVDEFKVKETINAMIFGPLGQEEHVLSLVTESGALIVKILKRAANFERNLNESTRNDENNSENTTKLLKIPQKNSVFLEQTVREKENSKAIYQNFQVELWRLRLTAARATVEAISSAESTISGDLRHAPIKLSAEVCGVGPEFRLFLTVENLSTRKEASNLSVLLHADQRHYKTMKPIARLPMLVPGNPIKIDFEVVAILDPNDHLPPPDLTLVNAIIRVMIIKSGQAKPLIAAAVTMPVSNAPLES